MRLSFGGDTLDINYIDEGGGDVVVLLHGWGAYGEVYRAVINMLTKRFRVIAPDFPGFGKSSLPSYPYEVEDYGDFVLAFLKELGVEKASFIGHSHGGRVLIELLSRESLPVAVEKAVLMDSAGLPGKKSLKKRAKIRVFKICKSFALLPPVKALYPDLVPRLRQRFGSADYASVPEVLQKSMVKLLARDLTANLSCISVPTLLLWGENDDATPLAMAKIMENAIPDAGLVTVKNGGHFCFTADPALVGRVLDAFL